MALRSAWRPETSAADSKKPPASRPALVAPLPVLSGAKGQRQDEPRRRAVSSFTAQTSELERIARRQRSVRSVAAAQRNAEDALRVAFEVIATADAADRAKSDFLANMSHELRTPLSAIIGFAEIMTQGLLNPARSPDKAVEYAGDIRDAGRHLLDLINDILDLAKVESGHLELNEDLLDTEELARSCQTMVGGAAAAAGLTLTVELPDPCPCLFADGRKLKQILVNLMSNAIKFTPRGGHVALRGAVTRDEGFAFSVEDSGIGIAPGDQSKVLQPFAQLSADLHSGKEGAGLGLPLTKAMAELHGGQLALSSEPGRGTVVTVRLPRQRVRGSVSGEPRSESGGGACVA